MHVFAKLFLLMTFCAAVIGCAFASFAPPKEPKAAVEAYRRFLLDTETPFPRRALQHLGLSVDVDPASLDEQRFSRLGPAPGNVFYYATVTLYSADPQFPRGKMNMAFDASVVCIKQSDLAALGFISPGMPIVNHEIRNGELVVTGLTPTPDRLSLQTPRGHIELSLLTMVDQGCIARIEHDIQLAPAR